MRVYRPRRRRRGIRSSGTPDMGGTPMPRVPANSGWHGRLAREFGQPRRTGLASLLLATPACTPTGARCLLGACRTY